MSGYQGRWLLVVLLWSAALVVFAVNLRSAAGFEQYRREVTTIRALEQFAAEHRQEIDASRREVASLSQEVESIDFGLLFLEARLAELAQSVTLEGFEFLVEPGEGTASRGVTIKVAGDYPDVARLVHAIEETAPHLALQKVVAATEASGVVTYQLHLTYFYSLKAEAKP